MNEQEVNELTKYYEAEYESLIKKGGTPNESHKKALDNCNEIYPEIRSGGAFKKEGDWRPGFFNKTRAYHSAHKRALIEHPLNGKPNNSKTKDDRGKKATVKTIVKEFARSTGKVPLSLIVVAIKPRKAATVYCAISSLKKEGWKFKKTKDGWDAEYCPPEPAPEPKQKHITPLNPKGPTPYVTEEYLEGISEEIKKKLKEAPLEMLLRNVDDLIDDIFDRLRK